MEERKITAIRRLADHTAEFLSKHLPSIYSRELVVVIFEQPYCRISDLVHRGIAQCQAASKYLKQLVTLGVFQEMTVGKEKLFINPKLMKLLSYDSNEFRPFETSNP